MKSAIRNPQSVFENQNSIFGIPNSTLLGALLLVLAVVLAYQPAWNAGFIWDDDNYVTGNPLLTAPDGLKRIWFSTDSPSQYFPLTYTTFRLEHALWGFHAAGYHWFNILLHAVNSLLVWRLLARLKVPGSWLAAAIFALHPVNVESVAWITELKNVQSLFFLLLALLSWVEFVESRVQTAKSRAVWYSLALLFHALALFSKTTACTLPAALLLILWLQRKPITWLRLAQVFPFVAFGAAMGVLSMWWERHHQGTEGAAYAMSFLERVLVASRAFWFYLGKFFWPANLSFNYPLWKINPADPLAYGWLVAGIALCVAIFFGRRFFGRSVEVAAVFFAATMAPLLGFVMLYTFRYTYIADHYQYVAMIGPAALIAAGISRITKSENRNPKTEIRKGNATTSAIRISDFGFRISTVLLSLVMLCPLATLAHGQSRVYQDLETLWQSTIQKNPESSMAQNNLGVICLAQGRLDEAIACFERTLEISPDHANARGNLGWALLRQGRSADALQNFQRALELAPCAKSHSDLAYALLQAGRISEAITHCRKATQLEPNFAEAQNTLGMALSQSGRVDDAISCFRIAARLQPASADMHCNLALALFKTKSGAPEAIAEFKKAVALQPDNAELQNNFGWMLLQNGRADEAISCFQTALKLQPEPALAKFASNNLAIAILRKSGSPSGGMADR
jgi:Flp pilus assembly protein TadD